MKIIVMGGSFNPPTIAHGKLMMAALDTIHADQGFFVPVSYAYLKRKMMDSGSTFCLSEAFRKQMLEVMCEGDSRTEVCDWDYHNPRSRTYDTMSRFQTQYPEAQLYFLMGADKLELVEQMASHTDFLSRFRIAMFAREGISPMNTIAENAVLAPFADRFAFVELPAGIDAISSTAVRAAMLSGGDTAAMLHPEVEHLLKTVKPEDFPKEIIRFKDEYAFLDNLYPADIEWEGVRFSCVEAAFQASKLDDVEKRRSFAAISIEKIKQKGSMLTAGSMWEQNKRDIMKQLVRLKFHTHPGLAQQLKATGNSILINGNNGKDAYWGTSLYSWDGKNELGTILMEVRDEL